MTRQSTQRKMARIKQAALDLFTAHGVGRVSMDEIAAQARVSKVTIYKYFGSKDELYAEVINLYIDETLAAAQEVLDSDIDFLEKLKFPIQSLTESAQLVSLSRLYKIWEQDSGAVPGVAENLGGKVRAMMRRLYAQGQREGYIDPDLDFDTLFLYAEIFRVGLQAVLPNAESTPIDTQILDDLYRLYFFGFIKKDRAGG